MILKISTNKNLNIWIAVESEPGKYLGKNEKFPDRTLKKINSHHNAHSEK